MRRRAAPLGAALLALGLATGACFAQESSAVESGGVAVAVTEAAGEANGRRLLQSPIVAFDRAEILARSQLGLEISSESDVLQAEILAENERVNAELEAEEKELLALKQTLSAEEFRPRADAFDAKVLKARAVAEERANAAQEAYSAGIARFEQALNIVLTSIARDVGAVAVFERQQIYLLSGTIDISNEAIVRLDARLQDAAAAAGAAQNEVSQDAVTDSVAPESDAGAVDDPSK